MEVGPRQQETHAEEAGHVIGGPISPGGQPVKSHGHSTTGG